MAAFVNKKRRDDRDGVTTVTTYVQRER